MTYRLQGGGAVGDAVAAARSFGEAHELAKADVARLCIIIEELVANLYDHGGQPETEAIELSFTLEPAAIRVIIADSAVPFDPGAFPSGADQSIQGAGAGLELVRAWAKILAYRSTEQGNRLELQLALSGHG